jgi:cell cycle checkpoint protein
MTKMTTFLSRHAFSSLSLSSDPSPSSSRSKERHRVLFMTSLPNLSHHATKEAFHAALLDFCKSYSTHSSPLIIVHSDAGAGGRAEESWMDRERGGREGALEVLGREVKDGPWSTEIE